MSKQVQSPVPTLPPVSQIADPATRRVLQALLDGWGVRNGQAGDGTEKFLTKADIDKLSTSIVIMGLAGASSMDPGGTYRPPTLPPGFDTAGALIGAVENLIRGSKLWRHLGERIEFMTADNNLSLARIQSLADGFTSQRVQQEGLLQDFEGMKVTVGETAGAITDEAEIRATQLGMLLQAINTMWAAAGTTSALVQDGEAIAVNYNAAQAQKWSQLQTEVFGADGVAIRQALAEEAELRAGTDGDLLAQYSVKIDQQGFVSGFGLMSEAAVDQDPVSTFIVRADRFAIGSPAIPVPDPANPPPETVPFTVLTTRTQVAPGVWAEPGVYMRDAFIRVATIDEAHIIDASVGTLKIKGEAVVIPRGAAGLFSAQVTIVLPVAARITMIGTFTQGIGRNGEPVQLLLNGYLQGEERPIDLTTNAISYTTAVMDPGTYTVAIKAVNNVGEMRCGITVLAALR